MAEYPASHLQQSQLPHCVLQSLPALPAAPVQGLWEDTLSTHEDSQGLLWLPTCLLPMWLRHSTHTHRPTAGPPQPSGNPRASSRSSSRTSTSETLRSHKFPLTLQLWRTHSTRTSQVMKRENHLSGSQRFVVGDKVLNCCPLLTLNSQQSAWRSAIITIHENSPFVSRAWRAFET